MREGIFSSSEIGDLYGLNDPSRFCHPIVIDGVSSDTLCEMLHDMMLIRKVEEKIGEFVVDKSISCPCHLSIGQEAVAVGVAQSIQPSDYVYGGHRSHAHYLSLGGELDALIAEVFGKKTGCSFGFGGSMHLYAPQVGFHGSVPIVGATIPVAVGSALAAKMRGDSQIAVAFFGDGACEEGAFHESMNLASSQNVPVIFICENNLYSSHLDITLRQPSEGVSRFAVAHRIDGLVVDGNDVLAVQQAAHQLVSNARETQSPQFLEMVTYRHRGHVGADENIDVGVRRSEVDVELWKKRCPLKRLQEAMISAGMITDSEIERISRDIQSRIEKAELAAREAPFPANEELLGAVYPSQNSEMVRRFQ